MLLGVAGGMARYLDVDPSIVRIIWVLLVLAGGAGVLLYIVAAIVMPEEPPGWAPAAAPPGAGTPGSASGPSASGASWRYQAGRERRDRGGAAVIFGIALIALGAWFLLRRLIPQIDSDVVWPVVLVILGGALVIGAMRRRP